MLRLDTGYARTVEGIRRVDPALQASGRNMRLNSHEAKNLTYQLNDVFQSIALGMPLTQVALQQGPQIGQLGIGKVLNSIKDVLTPLRVGLGLTAGAAVAGAVAWNGYLQSVKAVETAAAGLGRGVAGSPAEMESSARAGAAAAGISVKAARAMQVEFLRTGRVGAGVYNELIGVSKDFAATMGLTAGDAGAALAMMFKDPAQAADDLYNKYGLIDAATMRQAQTLTAQNRAGAAQVVLATALKDNLVDSEKAVTGLRRAWDSVARAVSNADDVVGRSIDRVIDGPTEDQRIARLREQTGNTEAIGDTTFITYRQRKAELEARLEAQRILRRQQQITQQQARDKVLQSTGLTVAESSNANASGQTEERLRNEIATLRRGQNIAGMDSVQEERVTRAIEAKENALAGLIGKQRIANDLDRIDIQIQTARDPLTRANLAGQRAALDLASEEETSAGVAIEAGRARNRVLSESIAAAQVQAAMMQTEAEIRGVLAVKVSTGAMSAERAAQQLQEEIVLRPLMLAAAAAEGDERDALTQTVEELRDAYASLADAQKEADAQAFVRGRQDRIADLQLELRLLGQTTEEQIRARSEAEANRLIEEQGLTGADAARVRAAAAFTSGAEINLNRGQFNRNQTVQGSADRMDVAITNAPDAISRADLEAQREYANLVWQGATADQAAAGAARVRTRAVMELQAATRTQARDAQTEVDIRQRLEAQVASGAITAADANRLLREELTLRPLIAAAAELEGDEKRRLLGTIDALRAASAAMAELDRQATGRDALRGQAEDLQRLRLERATIGANTADRTRLLALQEAENEIARMGLDTAGAMAQQYRENAVLAADYAREVKKIADAWGEVQSAASDAIDTTVDGVLNIDFSSSGEDLKDYFNGVLSDITGTITSTFAELAIKNPLKNALLGTDLGTMSDLDGMKGIWGRLTGKTDAEVERVSTKSTEVAAMNVTAANVTIQGLAMTAAQLAPMGSANLNAPLGALGGSGDVQAQVWQFFKDKGLAPHQIAGVMGNVSAESGFNPLAVGDGGDALGLFQHNDRSGALLNSIGGRGQLGDVKAQLEFVWQELMTTEAPSMRRLRNATDVTGATEAFVGFERPQGYSVANPQGAMHFDRRLDAAQLALDKFGKTAGAATGELGTLGGGFDAFGSALANIQLGTGGGGIGAQLLTGLASAAATALKLPGFRVGGPTGGSDPDRVAGLVHEREYVFDARATARIGVDNLEALRQGRLPGYRTGGYAYSGPAMGGAANSPSGPGGGDVFVRMFNYTGQPAHQEEKVDSRGQRTVDMVIGDKVATAIAKPGNPAQQALTSQYNVRKKGIFR